MRVVIAGAGSVGRSIARELIGHGHAVTLIDRNAASVSKAEWLLGDACEMSILEEARLDECDVVVAATGDDKANLVLSLISKTEFAVPRTVARVNNPKNVWMFGEAWGVDVLVSTPRIMFEFHNTDAGVYEFTLETDSPVVGSLVGQITWPLDVVLATIIRGDRPIPPSPDDTLEGLDKLVFVIRESLDEGVSPEAGTPAAQLQQLLGSAPGSTSATARATTVEVP